MKPSFLCYNSALYQNFRPSNGKYVKGLYEFFQKTPEDQYVTLPKARYLVTGRSWTASELRRKSFEDLHKLWYVLLKERNLLATMYEEAKRFNKLKDSRWKERHDERTFKTQKSMARIKLVLSERRVAYEYARRKDPQLFGLTEAPKSQKFYKDDGKPNFWRDGISRLRARTASRIQ
ncbi:18683_t:CDS:2 [Acaulospora morrowiae]|uniref:Large ribosomal subunit protein uL29m n=1 Tax=Acaulospora morrowiae TaxID=94023 RepID=A0A9N9F9V7_9GLOM|nr:18683_t:CDS:2 [Acaulospora morrowiae]